MTLETKQDPKNHISDDNDVIQSAYDDAFNGRDSSAAIHEKEISPVQNTDEVLVANEDD